MNRNNEWEGFVNDIKNNLPPQLEFSAQKAVTRKKKKIKRTIIITTPVAGLMFSFLMFVILENTSAGFALFMTRVPFLRRIAGYLTINPQIRSLINAPDFGI